MDLITSPPLLANSLLKDFSVFNARPVIGFMLTTFLIPFCAAQAAIGTVDCASVKLVRAIYGDFSVMIEVPAAVTI